MIDSLNLSWMPSRGLFFGLGCDCYGDVVIWIGPIYVSWSWSDSVQSIHKEKT